MPSKQRQTPSRDTTEQQLVDHVIDLDNDQDPATRDRRNTAASTVDALAVALNRK